MHCTRSLRAATAPDGRDSVAMQMCCQEKPVSSKNLLVSNSLESPQAVSRPFPSDNAKVWAHIRAAQTI